MYTLGNNVVEQTMEYTSYTPPFLAPNLLRQIPMDSLDSTPANDAKEPGSSVAAAMRHRTLTKRSLFDNGGSLFYPLE